MSNYTDPRWQKKRLEILNRDNFTCVACGDTETELNVHHMQYNGDLWNTPDDMMQTLCKPCHEALGPHPKGGIGWHFCLILDLIILHCPLCGSTVNEYDPEQCQKCGHTIKPKYRPDASVLHEEQTYNLITQVSRLQGFISYLYSLPESEIKGVIAAESSTVSKRDGSFVYGYKLYPNNLEG